MTSKLHRRDRSEEPVAVEYELPPEQEDTGTVCPVCGRRGRPEGHH